MQRPTSAERFTARWPAFRFNPTVRVSLWVSVVLVGAMFTWGAWQRRWIADDGLIVLRTVRNLLAGNGPVFNAGERVEANTSTVWTYLVTLGAWIGGPLKLEYVALTLALTLSIAGVVFVMLGTGRLYAPGLRGGGHCCCRRARWCTSRFPRRVTSPPRGSKTVWCWPISACCGG